MPPSTVGLLAHPRASFAVADFWRFVVVHLWVEDFLELFTTVMVAVIILDVILYSVGGVIGMAHHLYFDGEPAEVLALGAFFSALEVIPLTFLLRYLLPEDRWSDKLATISFWSLNVGLAWMCFVTLLPLGVVQLHRSVSRGYWSARELNFLTDDLNALRWWLRLPGDVLFIGGCVLPLLWMGLQGGAALALTAVNLVRNHAPAEIAAQTVVVVLAVARSVRSVARHRASSSG